MAPQIKIVNQNEVLLWDGSTFNPNQVWAKALLDKLRHQKKTLKDNPQLTKPYPESVLKP